MKVLNSFWHYIFHKETLFKVECWKHRVVQNKVDVLGGVARRTPIPQIPLSHWSSCYRCPTPTHRELQFMQHPLWRLSSCAFAWVTSSLPWPLCGCPDRGYLTRIRLQNAILWIKQCGAPFWTAEKHTYLDPCSNPCSEKRSNRKWAAKLNHVFQEYVGLTPL